MVKFVASIWTLWHILVSIMNTSEHLSKLVIWCFVFVLIALAEIRERDWSNVVTCHMDTPHAYVWRLQNFVLGEHILTPSADVQTPVKVMVYLLIATRKNLLLISQVILFLWIRKFLVDILLLLNWNGINDWGTLYLGVMYCFLVL